MMPDVKESLREPAVAAETTQSVSLAHRSSDESHDHEGHEHGFEMQDGVRIAVVAIAAVLVWFRVWEPFARVSIIGILGTLIGIYPIFREATENVMERRMTMELSMTIAILAALAIGQFFTGLIIVLFVLIAEVLEGLTVQRGRTAIRELLNLLPNEVTVRINGKAEQRSTDSIRPGETIESIPEHAYPSMEMWSVVIPSSINRL